MPETKKHYVYSARTTKEGLALLNKTKGDRSWDAFVNEAIAAHYDLPLTVMTLPLSQYQLDLEKRRAEKDKEKAAKQAERKAKAKAKAAKNEAKKAVAKKAVKKAAKKTGTKPTPGAVFESTAKEQGLIEQVTEGDTPTNA